MSEIIKTMDINDSWYDTQDELTEIPKNAKKEVLENSGLHNLLSSGYGSNPNLKGSLVNSVSEISLNGEPQLTMGEIISLDYSNMTELEILKNQCYISIQLKKYVATCKENSLSFDITAHLPKLEWLLSTSIFLSKKRHQKEIKLKKRTHLLQRNAYEFCTHGYKCQNTKCKQKHFVYNYVISDISELIKYLQTYNNESNIKEVYITINTINFVFNHMHEELTNLS